jgi:hypothetical protein
MVTQNPVRRIIFNRSDDEYFEQIIVKLCTNSRSITYQNEAEDYNEGMQRMISLVQYPKGLNKWFLDSKQHQIMHSLTVHP